MLRDPERSKAMLKALCKALRVREPAENPPTATHEELIQDLASIEKLRTSLQGFSPATREALAEHLAELESKIRRVIRG